MAFLDGAGNTRQTVKRLLCAVAVLGSAGAITYGVTHIEGPEALIQASDATPAQTAGQAVASVAITNKSGGTMPEVQFEFTQKIGQHQVFTGKVWRTVDDLQDSYIVSSNCGVDGSGDIVLVGDLAPGQTKTCNLTIDEVANWGVCRVFVQDAHQRSFLWKQLPSVSSADGSRYWVNCPSL